MLAEKAVHSAVGRTVRIGDVWIAQLDRKRVPQARSSGCNSSVAVTAECSRHHASRNVSWLQRAPGAVGHEAAVICQVERRLTEQLLANQTCCSNRIWGHNQKFIWGCFSLFFLSPASPAFRFFLSFPFSSPSLRSGPFNLTRSLRSAVNSSSPVRCRARAANAFLVYWDPEKRVSWLQMLFSFC